VLFTIRVDQHSPFPVQGGRLASYHGGGAGGVYVCVRAPARVKQGQEGAQHSIYRILSALIFLYMAAAERAITAAALAGVCVCARARALNTDRREQNRLYIG